MNHTCTHTSAGQTVMPALSEAEVRLVPDLAGQLSTLADPCQQTQPWFSEVAMSSQLEYPTNTSQPIVAFDNLTIKRWAPKVRVVYDYYPFGLTWENPKLPNDPEGVHDHAYQDKEFQFAEFSTGHGLALYDFHARMYDPATGRWLVPDPAKQFHNPYLAMGNNPVSYVDPDGELAVLAALAVKTVITAVKAAKVAKGAATVAKTAKGAAAVTKAGKASKTTKLISNAYTGGLNAMYNYHPDQHWSTTASYFAVGFGSGSLGTFFGGESLAMGKLFSTVLGGMGNLGVAHESGEISDGITTPLQAFTGGAVVGYSGMSFYAKKAGLKSKYLFGKGPDKLLTRGLTNMATNYAFTNPEDWSKMPGSQRWGSPFFYAAVGHVAEGNMPFDRIEEEIYNKLIASGVRSVAYSLAYGAEYVGMTFSRGYYKEFKDAKKGKWKKKAAIVGWKSLFYGIKLE